jgi:hypothetical protein
MDALADLASLGRRMRQAQARYFKNRTAENLRHAKDLEGQFDRYCADVLDDNPRLPYKPTQD